MLFHTMLRMLFVGWIILIGVSVMAQNKEFKIKDQYQSPSEGKKWAVIIGIGTGIVLLLMLEFFGLKISRFRIVKKREQ